MSPRRSDKLFTPTVVADADTSASIFTGFANWGGSVGPAVRLASCARSSARAFTMPANVASGVNSLSVPLNSTCDGVSWTPSNKLTGSGRFVTILPAVMRNVVGILRTVASPSNRKGPFKDSAIISVVRSDISSRNPERAST